MVTFISFLTSAIILTALQCLTLLTDANFRDADSVDAAGETQIAAKQ